MSLTRYLPTPSDRMGILWTLLQIDDAVILEYGTAGTTAYAMKTLMMRGLDVDGKLFTTGMGEGDVVMGDASRLEQSLLDLDKKYHPKVIFVMASSVASVTGSDVKGICNYMQEQISAQIIVFPQGGFSGDFSSGIQAAYTSLVAHLAVDSRPLTNSYNILGVSALSTHGTNDVVQFNHLMQTAFGLAPHAVLAWETSLQQIETMSTAKLNLVVSYEGLQAAQLLEERFGTPYVYGLPVGQEGRLKWMNQVSALLQLPAKPTIGKPSPLSVAGKKIAAYGDYDELVAIRQLAQEQGAEIQFLLCTHSLKHVPQPNADIQYLKTEREKIKLFEGLLHTLVLGDSTFWGHLNGCNQTLMLSSLL